MEKTIKYIILGAMLLIALTLCSTLVLYIFDLLMKIGFENIWFSGFKVALIAFVILALDKYRRVRKDKSKNENHSNN